MHLFKVWNCTRVRKVMVAVEGVDVHPQLITKASEKMQIDGVGLVLNSDGTSVDEDATLLLLKEETLILLGKGEQWMPQFLHSSSPISLPSTITGSSGNSSIYGMLLDTDINNGDSLPIEKDMTVSIILGLL